MAIAEGSARCRDSRTSASSPPPRSSTSTRPSQRPLYEEAADWLHRRDVPGGVRRSRPRLLATRRHGGARARQRGFPGGVTVHNCLVCSGIIKFGTRSRRISTCPRPPGEWIGAYSLSEQGSGTDAGSLKCRAEDKGDHYVLNGTKAWVTNAGFADFFLTFVSTSPELGNKGITALLVDKGLPASRSGKKELKLGIKASDTSELIFKDCEVPARPSPRRGGRRLQDRHDHARRRAHRHRRAGGGHRPGGLGRGASPTPRSASSSASPSPSSRRIQFKLADMAIGHRRGPAADLGAACAEETRAAATPSKRRWRSSSPREVANEVGHQGPADPRRLRLHPRVPGRALLPRRPHHRDLRGHSEIQRLIIAREVLGPR